MNFLLSWLDVAPDPVIVGAGAVILLIVIVFVLAVVFAGGLVFFLIWRKRRKIKRAEQSGTAEGVTA
jgi:flagellar basal body-associated protein FliL